VLCECEVIVLYGVVNSKNSRNTMNTINPYRYDKMFRVVILTISDRGSKGEREDSSGPLIQEMVRDLPGEVIHYEIIPDEKEIIAKALKRSADRLRADLILTTGGTGLSPRDVTPDATLKVIEKQVPGFSEAMRAESLKKTPHAMISRAIVGIRGSSLIVNLPGSPKSVRENLSVILPALPHALSKLKGDPEECGQGDIVKSFMKSSE
jgi:molybdenum cofactor synthesis domain-containing protein